MGVKVQPFQATQYNHIKCEVQYVVDQNCPPPVVMVNYEKDDQRGVPDTTFYHQHGSQLLTTGKPCLNESQGRAYISRHDKSFLIYELGGAFSDERATPTYTLPSNLPTV